MTTITSKNIAEEFQKIYNNMPNHMLEDKLKLFHTKQMWQKIRHLYDWTDEELDNAVDGYIGIKYGIKCYLTILIK